MSPSFENCFDCADHFVCHCLRITHADVVDTLARQPIRNLKELRQVTGAGDGCTSCHKRLKELIAEHAYAGASPICSVK